MVEDDAFSLKIDYLTIFQEITNLEGHPNLITGSRVMAYLVTKVIKEIRGFPKNVTPWWLELSIRHNTKHIFLSQSYPPHPFRPRGKKRGGF